MDADIIVTFREFTKLLSRKLNSFKYSEEWLKIHTTKLRRLGTIISEETAPQLLELAKNKDRQYGHLITHSLLLSFDQLNIRYSLAKQLIDDLYDQLSDDNLIITKDRKTKELETENSKLKEENEQIKQQFSDNGKITFLDTKLKKQS